MKIFGFEFGKKKTGQAVQFATPPAEVKDAEAPAERRQAITIAKIPRVKNPALSFKLRPGASDFEQPEYDMAEIGRIEDVESYVQRAFTQKEGLMFKEGYDLLGKNNETIKYIKRRFEQISAATGTPMDLILRGVGEDLIRFSNAFLVKVRDPKASGGRERRSATGRNLKPVAGYFHLPVSTVKFQRDDNGKVTKYRQQLPNGKYKDFSPEDVIHFYFRRKKGFLIGTPSLIPVKDDIRALRRIEENIEMLIYQHLFPLYHYVVGTEDNPASTYPDGTREIDVVKQEVEGMPAEGMIVTPERHKIEAIGAQGRALAAEGYLAHFKQRIFAGLGVSAVDMGEGNTANRSTADNMSRNLVDDVKHYQRTWENFVNEYIIKELLAESTFEDSLEEENLVYIRFNEIDIDSKIKVQNQAINLFSGHAITHAELRRDIGKEPFTDEDWDDSFWTLIEEPKALIAAVDEPFLASSAAVSSEETSITPDDQATAEAKQKKQADLETKAQIKIAKARPRTGATSRASRGTRAARAATTPSNQHGKKNSPEKRKSSFDGEFELLDMVAPSNAVTDLFNDLLDNAMRQVRSATFDINWFNQLAIANGTLMIDRLERMMRIEFRNGFRSAGAEPSNNDLSDPLMIITARAQRIINRMNRQLVSEVTRVFRKEDLPDVQAVKISSVFDSLRFRSRFIYNSEKNKASNYGKLRAFKKLGFKQVQVVVDENACEDCLKNAGKINTLELDIDTLPGFHPNCTCTIKAL